MTVWSKIQSSYWESLCGASGLWKAWLGISGLSVCVCVEGFSVITWPAAHETQAVFSTGRSQPVRTQAVCLYNVSVCRASSECELCFASSASNSRLHGLRIIKTIIRKNRKIRGAAESVIFGQCVLSWKGGWLAPRFVSLFHIVLSLFPVGSVI